MSSYRDGIAHECSHFHPPQEQHVQNILGPNLPHLLNRLCGSSTTDLILRVKSEASSSSSSSADIKPSIPQDIDLFAAAYLLLTLY
ncbi:predicted protein [Histoplasma capsulatum H143]|uniref:Uncharacterized protein n=1 Tax=Ajellomyces capsulatus (strain H143) TaxID=544712 RepID=C6H5S4_AJECH|nr:predicted protein [Histoplasma capsulatum H143]